MTTEPKDAQLEALDRAIRFYANESWAEGAAETAAALREIRENMAKRDDVVMAAVILKHWSYTGADVTPAWARQHPLWPKENKNSYRLWDMIPDEIPGARNE